MKRVIVRKREEKRVQAGHLWVFSNEIQSVDGAPAAGDIVLVCRHDGAPIGSGLYNPHSLIAVRILTGPGEQPDESLFRRRLAAAVSLRENVYPGAEAVRLAHGESDLLPGLIVDRYGTAIAIQTLSAGMDARTGMIADLLTGMLHPAAIVLRNESPLRQLEGLPLESSVMRGDTGTVRITEHGLSYDVDLLHGQKTGLFLDQRDNRAAVRRYLSGRRVLDCFCNAGGFGLNAAAAGASAVSAVDASAQAIESVRANAALNGVALERTETADAFSFLEAEAAAGARYGGIILDPPAFTKNRKTVATALKGYRRLNTLALGLLEPGGILVTASCSHHIDMGQFQDMVAASARRADRTITILERRGAAADHPVHPAMPETEYLKLLICAVR